MKQILLFLLLLMILSCSQVDLESETLYASGYAFECKSRELNSPCGEGFSSSGITCYNLDENGVKKGTRCFEGWVLLGEVEPPEVPIRRESDKPYKSGIYHCYPQEECCRAYGLLTNECVPI